MTASRRTRLDRLRALAKAATVRPGIVFFDALAGELPEHAARDAVDPVACVPRTVEASAWEAATSTGQRRLAALVAQALNGASVTVAGPFG